MKPMQQVRSITVYVLNPNTSAYEAVYTTTAGSRAKHPEKLHLIPDYFFPVSAIRISNEFSFLFTIGMNWTPLQWDVLKTQRLILTTGLPQILPVLSRPIFPEHFLLPLHRSLYRNQRWNCDYHKECQRRTCFQLDHFPGSSTVLAAGGASSYSWVQEKATSFISATPSGLTWYTVTGTDEFSYCNYW